MQLWLLFFVFCRIKGDAGFSHLLKSIPLKLFKAEDVQDANFKSGVAGTKRADRMLWMRKEMSPVRGQSYAHLKLLTLVDTFISQGSVCKQEKARTHSRGWNQPLSGHQCDKTLPRKLPQKPLRCLISLPCCIQYFPFLWKCILAFIVQWANYDKPPAETMCCVPVTLLLLQRPCARTCALVWWQIDFNGGFLITLIGLRWQHSLSDALNWQNTDAHTQTRCFTQGCRPVPAGSRWRCWPNSRRGVRRWPSPVGLCTAPTSPPCGAEWSRHLTKGRDSAINLGRLG